MDPAQKGPAVHTLWNVSHLLTPICLANYRILSSKETISQSALRHTVKRQMGWERPATFLNLRLGLLFQIHPSTRSRVLTAANKMLGIKTCCMSLSANFLLGSLHIRRKLNTLHSLSHLIYATLVGG